MTCITEGKRSSKLFLMVLLWSSLQSAINSFAPKARRVIQSHSKLFMRGVEPGNLFLMRNAEDGLIENNVFTGWIDTDLNEKGLSEVDEAAVLMLKSGYSIDVTYTSLLKRAIRTSILLNVGLSQLYKPIVKHWKLNERCYGALEGRSKSETAKEFGESTVQAIRTEIYVSPPPLNPDHPHWHGNDRTYGDIPPGDLPRGESLKQTMDRAAQYFNEVIKKDIKNGKNVMVVAHANSLRGIVRELEQISDQEAKDLVYFPRAIPLVYKFNKKMEPIIGKGSIKPFSGVFMEDDEVITKAIEREFKYASSVPGMAMVATTPIEANPDPLSNAPAAKGSKTQFDNVLNTLSSYERFMNIASTYADTKELQTSHSYDVINVTNVRKASQGPKKKEDARLVIIRHGKTGYNRLGVFTGWEDAPLIDSGRAEARKAGQLLKLHGVEFDVVYTSWLSRAVETAYIVMNELDDLWLPIIKSWRLNERMYGALTGMSKNMIKEKHGEKQFKIWRKSYDVPPPPVTSYSASYPGNDERYVKNAAEIDLRYSAFESFLRSISLKKFQLHKKFPKSESLKDCMDRTIPYYKNVIEPEALDKGKTVLIASSENAIRGLLMHLMNIPPNRVNEIEIPNGLPLVFDLKTRSVRLLDDGVERNDPLGMWTEYNFGASPDLLFRPCGTPDEDMQVGEGEEAEDSDSCFLYHVNGKTFKHDPIIRLDTEAEANVRSRSQKLDTDFMNTASKANEEKTSMSKNGLGVTNENVQY